MNTSTRAALRVLPLAMVVFAGSGLNLLVNAPRYASLGMSTSGGLGVNTTGSTVGTANVAPMAGLERSVGQRAAQGERIGHRNVRLCDEFGSAERR